MISKMGQLIKIEGYYQLKMNIEAKLLVIELES